MSLLDVIHSGVSIANKITAPLQGTVMYSQYLGPLDNYGTKNYAAPVPLKAIVNWKQTQVRNKEGILTTSKMDLTILDMTALAAATGGAKISNDDLFTLPDGSSGPILTITGYMDPSTGQPIPPQIFFG